MKGHEHYQEAERLVALALEQWDNGQCEIAHRVTMPQAQVHATLALAAATAEPSAQQYGGLDDISGIRGWFQVLS
jgi:hypothetical protein